MLKILIIGSSYSIKNTFVKKFNNEKIKFINFRKLWNLRNIDKFDIIILSGFHHKISKIQIKNLDNYVFDYKKFIDYLTSKTNKLILISTFIPRKKSFSRVVYFYVNLLNDVNYNKKIVVYSFKKIMDDKLKNTLFGKLLNILKIETTTQNDLIYNTDKFIYKKIKKPNFHFLKFTRAVFIERLLRLFDVD